MQSQYASLPNLYITLNKSNLHYNSCSTNYPLQEETGPGGNTHFASTDCDSYIVQSTWSGPHSSAWRKVCSPNTRQPAAVLKKGWVPFSQVQNLNNAQTLPEIQGQTHQGCLLSDGAWDNYAFGKQNNDVSCEGAKWASVTTLLTLLFIVSIWALILLPS